MGKDDVMRLSAALREALEQYRAIEKEIVAIGARSDAGRKQALVNMRRTLSEQIGVLAQAIEQDVEIARDADLKRELDQLFAGMRYSLALHQASWPVVRIDEDQGAYLASARGAQAKSDALWQWCCRHLGLGADRKTA